MVIEGAKGDVIIRGKYNNNDDEVTKTMWETDLCTIIESILFEVQYMKCISYFLLLVKCNTFQYVPIAIGISTLGSAAFMY